MLPNLILSTIMSHHLAVSFSCCSNLSCFGCVVLTWWSLSILEMKGYCVVSTTNILDWSHLYGFSCFGGYMNSSTSLYPVIKNVTMINIISNISLVIIVIAIEKVKSHLLEFSGNPPNFITFSHLTSLCFFITSSSLVLLCINIRWSCHHFSIFFLS